MTREEYDKALEDLTAQGNRIFSLTFRRRNDKKVGGVIVARAGELRHMVCRLHVTKGVKGVQPDRKARDANNNLVTVYEMAPRGWCGYKCVPVDLIVAVNRIPTEIEATA